MATVRRNIVIEGLSGMLGNQLILKRDNVAVADWFHTPEVTEIDLSLYRRDWRDDPGQRGG